jgi:hypothetical protein
MSTFTFDDLLAWSQTRLLWQRDALRRILTGSVTEADIATLVSMAKVSQGLPIPECSPPVPAIRAHIRSSVAALLPVALLAVRDIAYVNALAPGPLTFAPEGLTIIYGDNASGKSGVARILKKAGHARDPGGLILPCVFEPEPGRPASAAIDFRVGATDRSHSWVDGVPADNELTGINVFDASCAAVEIEESNRLAYTPEILQVFQDLAGVCQRVSSKLKDERDALDRERPLELGLLSLRSHTAAAILVANLSQQTEVKDVDSLCDVTDADRERLITLSRALQDNPTDQADLLEGRSRGLNRLDGLTKTLEDLLSNAATQDFENRLSRRQATAEAANAAREAFAAESSLAGIGTDAWKALWESARRYSQTLSYPTEQFPVTRESALCPLCQQPISRATAQRLSSFEQFVQNDVQQRAENAQRSLLEQVAQLQNLKIPMSASLQRDTALRGTQAGQDVKAFVVIAKLRRRYLLRRATGQSANRPDDLPPRPDLTPVSAPLVEEITRLRAAAETEERRKMQNEFGELDDRLKIAPLKNILKQQIARLKYCALLDRARSDCDTTWITRKAGEVAEVVVTARLRSAFASNLGHLGFASTPVEVKLGPGIAGQHPYRLALIAREEVPPSEILSEGEKTCVALAGFLAELETTDNRSGIVLDDPVSSLDHHYRVRVARLLADTAKQRQVVVFTHDIVFLVLLTKYGRKTGVTLKECSLHRGGPRHGIPEEGPPWPAMRVNKRIGLLRNELQAAAAMLRKGDRATCEQKSGWIYDRLRQTWERAVEEVLLNEVVVRFGDAVSTQQLRPLTDISDEDVQCVDSEMSYCSGFIHDQSGAVNASIPDPSVIETDIKRLEDWVSAVRKRRKQKQ